MSLKISNLAEIRAMGKGQTVLTVTARIKSVARPYNQSEIDAKYGWNRQMVLLGDDDGITVAAVIYSDTMHLRSDAVGEVWRFRCMNSDSGPKGISINRWTPKPKDGQPQPEGVELKIHSDADMTRFQFADGQPQNQEPIQTPTPVSNTDQQQASGTESRVITDLQKYAEAVYSGEHFLVAKDIADRQHMGIAKYGQTVQDNPLSLPQWLQHAYEESLDSMIYHRRAVEEIDRRRADGIHPPEGMKMALIKQYQAIINQGLLLKRMILDLTGPGETSQDPTEDPPFQRGDAVRFVAINIRWNYTDEADTTPSQREDGLAALRMIKDFEIGFDEAYDLLVARDRRDHPQVLERAFDGMLARVRNKKPETTPDMLCESIVKFPDVFRHMINEVLQEVPT